MDKEEFQRRINKLGLPREELAARLGLSVSGLNHQLYGVRAVSRQTEIILGHLEREQAQRERSMKKLTAITATVPLPNAHTFIANHGADDARLVIAGLRTVLPPGRIFKAGYWWPPTGLPRPNRAALDAARMCIERHGEDLAIRFMLALAKALAPQPTKGP